MKSYVCSKCNGVYASSQSLWNHKQRCKADASVEDNDHRRMNDSQRSRFIDSIINNKPQDDIIQPLKSTSMSYSVQAVKEPVQETAMKLNITPKSDKRPTTKKRKLNDNTGEDDASKLKDRLSSLMLSYFNDGQYYHHMEIYL